MCTWNAYCIWCTSERVYMYASSSYDCGCFRFAMFANTQDIIQKCQGDCARVGCRPRSSLRFPRLSMLDLILEIVIVFVP